MAGHSQFKNIMHRKGRQDAKRAKIFSKIGREITVAAKLGGPDPSGNPRLRAAVLWAREESMPNDRIKKAIDVATGANADDNYEEVSYEGYGPGGVAIIVDALTNNRNRTAGDVRSSFSKYGGNLGETNSVRFMFDRVGEIKYKRDVASSDAMFEAAVESGADDCESDEDSHIIQTATDQLGTVLSALEEKFGEPEKSSFVWKPNVMTSLDEEQAKLVMKLIDVLEDNDDVQTVTTNFEVSEDVMERLLAS
ncbi:MAG: YebC/PmpR family DNA-binding transcriptional regulator [Micavibrio aeruginosavorus]|uniref:Probable transcriptional regulatory protein HYS17_07890 n=1 Tax=Micavibrio aeruginosavorus TaxID=349221 RepID=A0A7T5R0X4_9BACT|nr:MAG: YebC/PmpR family DNA-binding transcriptional regulator [Micavibrio aeruginosavorus]